MASSRLFQLLVTTLLLVGSFARRKRRHAETLTHPSEHNHSGGRYAYVMLAFDPPGASPNFLSSVLPMARALQEVSSYPLVVLTNATHFPDGTVVNESLAKLNVQVLPVQQVPLPKKVLYEHRAMPCALTVPPTCGYHFLKLQIWHLTQFDKLIYLDSDAILTKSIDGLFSKNGTWAQQDNWHCGSWASLQASKLQSTNVLWALDWLQRKFWLDSFQVQDAHYQQSSDPCSGLLLLEPNDATYKGLVQYTGTLTSAPKGDQGVITNYFEKVAKTPLKLMDLSVASFGQCLDKVPGGVMPAFVHKSDWGNRCFDLGASANACRSHPLGKYWYTHFCDAATTIGLKDKTIIEFCKSWDSASADEWSGHSTVLGDIAYITAFFVVVVAMGKVATQIGKASYVIHTSPFGHSTASLRV